MIETRMSGIKSRYGFYCCQGKEEEPEIINFNFLGLFSKSWNPLVQIPFKNHSVKHPGIWYKFLTINVVLDTENNTANNTNTKHYHNNNTLFSIYDCIKGYHGMQERNSGYSESNEIYEYNRTYYSNNRQQ